MKLKQKVYDVSYWHKGLREDHWVCEITAVSTSQAKAEAKRFLEPHKFTDLKIKTVEQV